MADPEELAREAYGNEPGEKEALAWAEEFEFTHVQRVRDLKELQDTGSLAELVRRRQEERRAGRLNEHRLRQVEELLPSLREDEAYVEAAAQIRRFLLGGFHISAPDGFKPNAEIPAMGRWKKMERPIAKHAADAFEKGHILLFPEQQFLEELVKSGERTRIHGQRSGWARKSGKDKGRPTYAPNGFNYPASATRDRLRARFWKVKPPTLHDIMGKVLEAESVATAVDGVLLLWKMDFQGAFHLLDFHWESVHWTVTPVGLGMVAVWMVANFGLSQTPFMFDPISRVSQRITHHLGRLLTAVGQSGARALPAAWQGPLQNMGLAEEASRPVVAYADGEVYVDDTMAVGVARPRVSQDAFGKLVLVMSKVVYEAFLGDEAVADDKTVIGRMITDIGWEINADERTVRMSQKTILKLIYFLGRCCGKEASGEDLEVATSLVERMSEVVPLLRAFVPHLYGAYAHLTTKAVKIQLTGVVMVALAVSRSIARREWAGAVYSWDRFRVTDPQVRCEFDGSLYGGGFRVWDGAADHGGVLLAEGSLAFPGEATVGESVRDKLQNNCELLACVAGLCAVACRRRGRPVSVLVNGDSEVAQSWLTINRYKSPYALRSALAVMALDHICGVRVVDKRWKSKTENTVCDAYSRGVSPAPQEGVWCIPLSGAPSPELGPVRQLVELCNPWRAVTEPLDTPARLDAFLVDLHRILLPLSDPGRPPLFPPQVSGGGQVA